MNRLEDAEHLCNRVLRIRRFQLGEDFLSVADLLSETGEVTYRLNRLEESEASFREAIRMKELKLGHKHVDIAQDIGHLGLLVCGQDCNAGGADLLNEAFSLRNSLMGNDPVFEDESKEQAESLNHLADMAVMQNRTDDAERLY